MDDNQEHYCNSIETFPFNKFLQAGREKGAKVLILGESPASNGWRKSGRAFYTPEGKLLPSGKNLNALLSKLNLSVETCAFTELVKCYVGKDRKLLTQCGAKCWPIFLTQLASSKYSLIIILGVKTLELFNKFSGAHLTTGKLAKTKIGTKNYTLLPIYHPSPIAPFNHQRNFEIFTLNAANLKELLQVACS